MRVRERGREREKKKRGKERDRTRERERERESEREREVHTAVAYEEGKEEVFFKRSMVPLTLYTRYRFKRACFQSSTESAATAAVHKTLASPFQGLHQNPHLRGT